MILPLILLAIGLSVCVLALRSLRRQRLKERYALLLLVVGLPFFVVAAWPDVVGSIAAWLGIEYHTVLLLGVTTFFLLMNVKLLSIVSRHAQRIDTLAQIIGILAQEQEEARGNDADVTFPLPSDEQEPGRHYRRGA
jgi:hypothetical protein